MIRTYAVCILILFLAGCASTTDVRNLTRQNDVEGLTKIIQESHDKELRIEAITALGTIRDPRAIGTLTKALDSDSWIERETAVKSLGNLRDYLAIKPIVKALNDNNRFVRDSAHKSLLKVSSSLGRKKDPRVIKYLMIAIRDSNDESRKSCIEAFQTAINELSRTHEPTFIKQLIAGVTDENKYVRIESVLALGQFDDPRVIEPLTIALKDTSEEVRDAASVSLQRVHNPKSAEPLFEALKDKNPDVRDEAASVLGQYKDPQVINKLIHSLSDPNPYVRAGAAKAMAKIIHPRAMKPLVKLLDDNHAYVRLAASNTLEIYHWRPRDKSEAAKYCVARQSWDKCADYKKQAIKPLIVALNGEDPDIRREASLVLTKLDWQPKDNTEKGYFCVAKQDWEECKKLGKYAVPALTQELKNDQWQNRIKAADTLAYIKDPQSIDPLIKSLNDKNADVRAVAVEALGVYKDVRVVAPLIQALDDHNRLVRKTAASVLESSIGDYRKLNNPQVTAPFIEALQDNNRGVRVVAAQLLGDLKDPAAADALIIALEDVDTDVRIAAKESLYKLKDSRAINSLVAALNTEDPKVRSEVVGALSEYKDHRAIDPLLESVNDYNAEVRIKTIKVLSKIDDPRVVEPLIEALKDYQPSVRLAAANALVNIDDERVTVALKNSFGDLDVDVREAVRKTLLAKNWQPENKKEQAQYCIAKRDWILCEELGKYSVDPLLLELKQEKSPYQVEAARVLGQIKDPATIEPLITAISNSQWIDDEYKRKTLINSASRALQKFGIQAVPALKATLTQWYTAQYTAEILQNVGWVPRTEEEEIHFLVARRANTDLQALWPDTKRILLKDIESKDSDRINNALYAFIGIGKEEVINDLLKLLDNNGSIQIAEAYLNSGNDKLVKGAVNWTSDQGLVVKKYSEGNSPVEWGKL
jgi:HEAT repeat protein